MGEGEHWARRMPWRLMGFGAAFIGALFAWRYQKDAAPPLQRVAVVQVDGASAGIAPPTAVVAPVAEVLDRRSRVKRAPSADERFDVAVEVQNEELSTYEETTTVSGAATAPQRVVVLVHERAPAVAAPTYARASGASNAYPLPHQPPTHVGGGPRPGGLTPRIAPLPSPRRPSSLASRGASRPRGGGRSMPRVTGRGPARPSLR